MASLAAARRSCSICYISFSNHIAPSYTPASDLGIGSQILTAALKSVTGLSQSALRKLWNQSGDSGDVAFDAKVNSPLFLSPSAPPVLTFRSSIPRRSLCAHFSHPLR